MKGRLLAAASTAAFFLSPAAAFAQATDPEPEEHVGAIDRNSIIVTSTRREVELQDVPLSITAFQQEDLTEMGVVGYEGLAHETPGVVINKPTANFNNFSARGLAINGYNANLQSTVAIYIDELPISANGNSTILDPSLFDVERVEFLRGPQGTLFGSGSLAGALRIITRSPDLYNFEANGLVDFGLTTGDSFRQRYNAVVNVPIAEGTAALRAVGFYRHEEGWVDNLGTGVENSNTLENFGGRATLLIEPTERLSAKFMVSYEQSNPEDSSLINPDRDPDRETRFSDRPDLFQGELLTGNATITYDFDFAELTSSTTLSRYDALFYVDLAATFGQAIPFALDADAYDDLFVEEVRLASTHDGPVEWVLGGFYFYKRRDVDFDYRSSPEFLAAHGMTGLPDEYYLSFRSYSVSRELAAFGELTYRFGDNFWLTGGLRYGSVEVQGFTEEGGYDSNYLTNALFGIDGPLTVTPVAAAVGEKAKGSKASFKLSASYKPTDDITTYATVSTGFRTPIVNARAGQASALDPNDIIIPDGAGSDKLTNYELGIKGEFLDGHLFANLAAYRIDWSNIQVQANRVSDSVQFATNIGAAVSKGLEFEITALPATGLSLTFTGSLNDSEVSELSPAEAAISGATLGAQLAFPEFQGTVRARYDFNLEGSTDAWITASLTHVGDFPGMFENVPGQPGVVNPLFARTESFETVNAAAGVVMDDVNITLYVENLFNDHSITYVHPEAFIDGRFGTLRPRTVGVRIGTSF
ncbi:TonB-dependent receptor [Alteraurantiacibacter aquimixticola]|uniref:TonB-dependent receptor n=1 Tax=Alteraurantiacibacter aquimixticola TaxID=2489173 RepID=A0A4T3F5F0_9SPHN|nr:TonB-dependent receptor [Alteraurantiacibacter aquimixticola]TIX51709.1 TonB-dependent receptor [Alteraurantiacibacter aquimixticola]